MDGATGLKVIVGYLHLISELLSTKDQSDLINHDTFLLLECLFNLQDGVISIEVETLLSTCEGL